MQLSQLRVAVIIAATIATVAGCGDSSGSANSGTGMTSNPTGMVNVALTDAPSSDYDHVWVTVTGLWFHQSDAADPDDSGWLRFPLSAPQTVDLLQLANGNLAQVFSGLTLPVGEYKQIRVFLADPDAALTSSAQANLLSFNDQVDYTDTHGVAQIAPLELVNPEKGIGLFGSFTVSAATTLSLAIDFDVDRDVLKFFSGGDQAYVLKPRLVYFDLSHVGAIVGSIDPSDLASASNPNGAFNLVIKAETLSADNSHHVVDRATTIRADGSFTLFPLHIPTGSMSTTYDVMLRGRSMETIIIKSVPVQAGTGPAAGQNPTALTAHSLELTSGQEYTANESPSTPINPTSADVQFYQTVPGMSEVPYEIRFRAANPFTGLLTDAIPLSSGPVHYGVYVTDGDPTFAVSQPQEGIGAFQAFGDALYYARTAANELVTQPTSGVENFAIPALNVMSPATANAISGSLMQKTAGKYNAGYLLVSRDGLIVTTIPLDATLALNNGTGGPYSVTNLPGGSAAQPFSHGIYYLWGRVWNTADPRRTVRRVAFHSLVDLRESSATAVNLQLN